MHKKYFKQLKTNSYIINNEFIWYEYLVIGQGQFGFKQFDCCWFYVELETSAYNFAQFEDVASTIAYWFC